MFFTRLLYLSLTIVLVFCTEKRGREVHRLVGGHLRIINPGVEDAELLEGNSSGTKDQNSKNGGETKDDTRGEEEKKTLSQQVADGKYGLIQREIFKKPLKQPGIISYDPNPEIPKDTIHNLGGLSKEEIWLAENHLLVLKGGNYPKHDDKLDNTAPTWPAIDNYTAPKRPVKIPTNPKIPPPFPVQLTKDGPLQILGTNSSRTLDGPPPIYAVPPDEGGYVPGTGPFFPQYPDQTNPPPRGTPNQNSPNAPGEGQRGPPFPQVLNGTLPPFFAHLPPGAVAVPAPLPPSINDFDEDDPSIYYPPPYTFFYPSKDNSSLVPAGPLVPGIILPPPPDFFAPLEPPSTKKPVKSVSIISKRPKIQKTTEQSPQVHPTTTPIPPTSVINITLRKPIKVVPNNPTDINNELKPVIITTPVTKVYKSLATRPYSSKTRVQPSRHQTKRPSVTILKPVKPIESHRTYYSQDSHNGKPFSVYGPPNTTAAPKITISSTRVPLKQYYSTSEDINSNIVTDLPERSTVKPAQYYYYEEEPQTNSITTPQPNKIVQNFFNLPDEYYEAPKQVRPPDTQYIYVTSKPFSTPKPKYNLVQHTEKPNSFSLNLAKLKNQIKYYTSPRPSFRQIHSPKPVYQYSFQAANYESQQQNNFRPSQPERPSDDEERFRPMPKYSVQIQSAIEIPTIQPPSRNPIYFKQSFRTTTERPSESQRYYTTSKPNNYQESTFKKGRNLQKSNPNSQYSFEAAPVNQDYRGFYIQPESNYYDNANNHHEYPMFGQRLQSHTTPVPNVRYPSRSPNVVYITANSNSQPQQKPVYLGDDTLVNYINPRPNINPDAEFIPVNTPHRINYPKVTKHVPRPIQQYNADLQHQNYNARRPAQIVNAIPVNIQDENTKKGSFISYSLPGDNGAHFYFLTPQLAQSRDQGAGYYYSQADRDRKRRNSESENKR
ncbi:hypothetical protein HHI36_011010 [Cryptolaemus montrouzieri]|uniref:Uncharacterized protein n=1 Tax=Cryptolaemus montrouzieri TaxID=559131 RepID=A0ABD2MKH9_9CUCU